MTECSKGAVDEMQYIFDNAAIEQYNNDYTETVIKIFGYATDGLHQCAVAA